MYHNTLVSELPVLFGGTLPPEIRLSSSYLSSIDSSDSRPLSLIVDVVYSQTK